MKTNYLLPHSFRKFGWILLIPSSVFGVMELLSNGLLIGDKTKFEGIIAPPPWTESYSWHFRWGGMDELISICMIIALLFIAFAKEKKEDEYTLKIRSESLTWAVIVNYLIIIAGTLLIYEVYYLTFLIMNLFTVLMLYIIKFRIAIYQSKKIIGYEK